MKLPRLRHHIVQDHQKLFYCLQDMGQHLHRLKNLQGVSHRSQYTSTNGWVNL